MTCVNPFRMSELNPEVTHLLSFGQALPSQSRLVVRGAAPHARGLSGISVWFVNQQRSTGAGPSALGKSGLKGDQLRDLGGAVLLPSSRHRKSPCPKGRRPWYRLDQDLQGRPTDHCRLQREEETIATPAVSQSSRVHLRVIERCKGPVG